MQKIVSLIISTKDQETLKELDDLCEEMLGLEVYQKELIQQVSERDTVQILKLSELKFANNSIKCFKSYKEDFYKKMIKDGEEMILELLKGVYSKSISHADLCRDAIILVKFSVYNSYCV